MMQPQHLLICTYIGSLQKHYEKYKADQTDAAHYFLSHYSDLFS